MKRIIALLLVTTIVVSAYTQTINQSDVPAVLLNAFHLKFPNATDTKWKLQDGNYYINFKNKGKKNELLLDYKGTQLSHKQDLYISEIPPKVIATMASKLEFFDIHDADKLSENGDVTYNIYFKAEGRKQYFWIGENGNLIKYRKELNENEVPVSIMNAIKAGFGTFNYDRSKYVEEPTHTIYMIRGEINEVDHLFVFNNETILINHTTELAKKDIPLAIMNKLSKQYKGYEIRSAELINESGKETYSLKLRKSKKNILVSFSPNGEIR